MTNKQLLALIAILCAGASVRLVPAFVNSYPIGHETGYFYAYIKTILENDFGRPLYLPHYWGGIPFAYPPLAFFAYAAISKLSGLSIMTLLKYLPPILSSVCIIPFYFISRWFFRDEEKVLFSTLCYALIPASFFILKASGTPREMGLIFLILGSLSYARYFESKSKIHIALSGILLGLAISTHPISALHLIITFFVFFSVLGRGDYANELPNLGTIIAIGAVLSAPYWTFVIENFGIDPFMNAAILHLGAGSPASFLYSLLHITEESHIGLWAILAGLGFLYSLIGVFKDRGSKDLLIITWVASLFFISERAAHTAVPLSILASMGFFGFILPRIRKISRGSTRPWIALTLVAIAGIGLGNSLLLSIAGRNPIQSQLNPGNIDAMIWMRKNISPRSTTLVIGDGKTWIPAISQRNCIGMHTGLKWKGDREALIFHWEKYHITSSRELVDSFDKFDIRPDYIYVDKKFMIYPSLSLNVSALRESLEDSESFRTVFQNDEVQVFKVVRGFNRHF